MLVVVIVVVSVPLPSNICYKIVSQPTEGTAKSILREKRYNQIEIFFALRAQKKGTRKTF